MVRFILVKCCHAHISQESQQMVECYEINYGSFFFPKNQYTKKRYDGFVAATVLLVKI